jgi:lipid A 4'-phosphatase
LETQLPKKRKIHLLGLTPLFLISFGAAVILFYLFPKIDIWTSMLFYSPETGFFLKANTFVLWVYGSVEFLVRILIVSLPGVLLVLFIRKKPIFSISLKKIAYLVCVLALGPGLMVNVVLKNHWGRARPDQIEVFGGNKQFTIPFVWSGECESNCSFVSGHASVGFYGVAGAFLLGPYQIYGIAISIFYGMLIGLGRIMQGGHFLSDVVFSFFLVYAIARMLYYLMFERSRIEK